MALKLMSSGGGSVTLDVPSTASNLTLTVPATGGETLVTGSASQTTLPSPVLVIPRQDTNSEGGELRLLRANTANGIGWIIDVVGNTNSPALRIFNEANKTVLIDGNGVMTKSSQPSASWRISYSGSGSSITRNYTIYQDVASNCSAVGSPQGSPGSVVRFTAPVAGKYLVSMQGSQVATNVGTAVGWLASIFGSFSGATNAIQANQEMLDTRAYRTDDVGTAFVLNLSAGDYINPDSYQGYESGGNLCVTVYFLG